MQSSARVINTPIDSALHRKIKPVTSRVSNRVLWLLFFGSLVISDTLMTAFAFRLAYFFGANPEELAKRYYPSTKNSAEYSGD